MFTYHYSSSHQFWILTRLYVFSRPERPLCGGLYAYERIRYLISSTCETTTRGKIPGFCWSTTSQSVEKKWSLALILATTFFEAFRIFCSLTPVAWLHTYRSVQIHAEHIRYKQRFRSEMSQFIFETTQQCVSQSISLPGLNFISNLYSTENTAIWSFFAIRCGDWGSVQNHDLYRSQTAWV